jgi:hypothetical protein
MRKTERRLTVIGETQAMSRALMISTGIRSIAVDQNLSIQRLHYSRPRITGYVTGIRLVRYDAPVFVLPVRPA